MTKLIRIENADLSTHKVKVNVYDRSNATPAEQGTIVPDRLVESYDLNSPCAMKEVYIHSSRYIVIEEFHEAPETIKE